MAPLNKDMQDTPVLSAKGVVRMVCTCADVHSIELLWHAAFNNLKMLLENFLTNGSKRSLFPRILSRLLVPALKHMEAYPWDVPAMQLCLQRPVMHKAIATGRKV
jgi:hypothetical protein